jgi:hypothetical protein
MAKFRAPKPKTGKTAANLKGVLPCLFLVLMIFGVIMILFYWVLKSS